MYILYGGRFTRALLTEMVMLEGDISYELREIDIVNDQHRTPEFLSINPSGWVPALITPQAQTLYETPAINLYLTEQHRLTHLTPGVDESDRGLFLSGLFYAVDELEPVMKRYFYPHRFVMREADTPKMKERALKEALKRFTVIDKRLNANGPYHLGERFSLVDLTVVYWSALIKKLDVSDNLPALKRCTELVMERSKIRHKFDEQAVGSVEYAELQARGGGVR